MYKILTVGGKKVGQTNSRMEAMIIANQFSNENCTFTKVMCGDMVIATFV